MNGQFFINFGLVAFKTTCIHADGITSIFSFAESSCKFCLVPLQVLYDLSIAGQQRNEENRAADQKRSDENRAADRKFLFDLIISDVEKIIQNYKFTVFEF